ncbi:prephenate dehydratase domain-containing protein [Rhizobium sp. RCC_161_2]|uniref:prephenate dehydratase domain-containing protein n=1 Tax=Rhizobium sp. RCC_161_2 TaxID=3239219 RepID=UPI003526128E
MTLSAAHNESGALPPSIVLDPQAERFSSGEGWLKSDGVVHSVGYNGRPGAFADVACRAAFPAATRIAMPSLEAAVRSVAHGEVDRILLPCENSLVGRVPDVHRLVPDSGLHIVGEHFQRVEHCLMAPRGASLAGIRRVHSHPVALGQISRLIAALDLEVVAASTTSHAAEIVALRDDPSEAAIASDVAADLYGLQVLKRNVEDDPHNTTRFYVLSAEPQPLENEPQPLTTIVFRTENRPGCLYHAIAGFADSGINMTKLESYLVGGQFVPSRFLCEFEGDPRMPAVAAALGILGQHAREIVVLGTFPMAGHHLRTRSDETLRPRGNEPPPAFQWTDDQTEGGR